MVTVAVPWLRPMSHTEGKAPNRQGTIQRPVIHRQQQGPLVFSKKSRFWPISKRSFPVVPTRAIKLNQGADQKDLLKNLQCTIDGIPCMHESIQTSPPFTHPSRLS